jgi:hypothetical protein
VLVWSGVMLMGPSLGPCSRVWVRQQPDRSTQVVMHTTLTPKETSGLSTQKLCRSPRIQGTLRLWQREFQNAMESAGFEMRCQIIWAKNTFAWGFGRYKFQHEPIFYAHVTNQKDPWYGDKSQSTLWEERKPAANRIHPTAKPVELVERALVNSSKAGDIVMDLFGGSGSTLIGCERRGRKARLMELDPKYVDCIVRRWEQYTGQQATLDADGRSFEVLAAERMKGAA